MRLWNLVKGRCQYTSSLQQEAELVRFSPTGEVGCCCASAYSSALAHRIPYSGKACCAE
jgi:hypothetical protein